jgi:hypothetical protein
LNKRRRRGGRRNQEKEDMRGKEGKEKDKCEEN